MNQTDMATDCKLSGCERDKSRYDKRGINSAPPDKPFAGMCDPLPFLPAFSPPDPLRNATPLARH